MVWRKAFLVLLLVFIAGSSFSFAAQTSSVWNDLFPQGLLDRNGNKVSLDTLNGKFVGIYFAAQWCSSCKSFSPLLVPFRNEQNDRFEVVFVSADKNKQAQFAYMNEMGMAWPTLEYRSAPALALKSRFEITSIPTLVVLSPNGELITRDGTPDVRKNPAEALNKWESTTPTPLPFSIVADQTPLSAGRLENLDAAIINEVNAARSIPKLGWIKGTIGSKDYYVAINRTEWTIKGNAGDKPFDIKIDHENKTIRGYAHDSGVDLTFTWTPEKYSLEGEAYGYPYWINLNWPTGDSMGGISCSMLEFFWNTDTGVVTGVLGERKANLKFDKISGRLTGDFFNRKLDLQITNLELSDFLQYNYLFLK
ncbi:MAG: thioredoxin-like domain-containing protein [Candidatus Rifleibacteriota bacterium]